MDNLKMKGLARQAMQHVAKKAEQMADHGYKLDMNGMKHIDLNAGYNAHKEGRDVMSAMSEMGMKR